MQRGTLPDTVCFHMSRVSVSLMFCGLALDARDHLGRVGWLGIPSHSDLLHSLHENISPEIMLGGRYKRTRTAAHLRAH